MIDLRSDVLEMFARLSAAGADAEDTANGFGLAGAYRDTERSRGDQWLKANGYRTFFDNGDQLFRAKTSFRQRKAETYKRYAQTTGGRERILAAKRRWAAKNYAAKKLAKSVTP